MDPTSDSDAAGLPAFLKGGSEMARRIADHDWRATPLGDIPTWPQSLRTALSIVLNSGFPSYLVWGPQLIGFYNDAYLPIIGSKQGLGVPFQETWKEAWEQVGPIAQRALAGESTLFENLPLVLERHGYPEPAWFTFSYSPIRDETGEVGGMLCTVVETTASVVAQRRAAFQLKLADGLRGLTDPDEITGWTCRVLGEHLHARRAGYATISAAETVDVSLAGWLDASTRSVRGQSFPLAGFGPDVVAELRGGTTVRLVDVHADPRTRGYTGVYDLLGTRSMLVVPVVRDGRLIATLAVGAAEPRLWSDEDAGLSEDAAERTRAAVERALAEQALKQQLESERDRLRMLFDQAPTFMTALRGPDHVYELVNPAYERLIGEREFIGRPVREVIPETIEQGFIATLDEVYASGKPLLAIDASLQLQQTPGEPPVQRYVDFIYQPIIEPDGSVSGIFILGSDVTERKRATEALREADQRKDDFLAMLAHELRNPLAPISTAAQLLRLSAADEQRVREVATIIGRQVAHMTKLVDDLLDVSRVTRGLIRLDQEVLELGTVLESAVEQVRPFIEARGHALAIEQAPGPMPVRGDRTRLVQILVNLLNNAAKYTPQAGRIALKAEVANGEVRVAVSDSGLGIPPALLPHVFELFTQGERTPDRSHGGLGLGLALVRSLAELHQGRVTAHSEGANRGSTFTLHLPRVDAPRDRPDLAVAPGLPRAAHARTVMVVDDNADAGDTLAELLRAYGHRVSVHRDAQAALDAAARTPHDAYILDIGLPGMDGYALVARLKQRRENAAALFIALTGYGQPEDVQRAEAAGFAHHFAKPADGAAIAALLDGQAATPD